MIQKYKKVLIAIDGSEDSMRAALRVKEIVNKNTKVVIFNALEEHFYEKFAMMGMPNIGGAPTLGTLLTPERLTEIKKSEAYKILEKAKNLFRGTLMPVELRVIKDESPEDYILEIVKEENFDLVAIGCEGEHSVFRTKFLGTIGSKLLNESPCDLLVVR